MAMKVAVIGDGGWGTALAMVLTSNGHHVTVWGAFPEHIDAVKERGENELFLPGTRLPSAIEWTHDRRQAVADADVVVIAVPTKFFAHVMLSFSGLLPGSCHVVSVAKGLDRDEGERMSRVAARTLRMEHVSALSGPSHAEEVAAGIPTAVVVASSDGQAAVDLQNVFSNESFRVYTSDDVAGVELGGALKNVIAIAVGVSDGIGFGDNARAAIITRGLAEMTRLGCRLGARETTFTGLSGMGDLVVTCTSKLSRNRGVGERIGKGVKLDAILGDMKQVAEGVWNSTVIRDIARRHEVEVPIVDEVCAVLHEDKSPRDAVESLMQRPVRPEAGKR